MVLLIVVRLLNKIDRLILELQYTPEEAYAHLKRILEGVNAISSGLFKAQLYVARWRGVAVVAMVAVAAVVVAVEAVAAVTVVVLAAAVVTVVTVVTVAAVVLNVTLGLAPPMEGR